MKPKKVKFTKKECLILRRLYKELVKVINEDMPGFEMRVLQGNNLLYHRKEVCLKTNSKINPI